MADLELDVRFLRHGTDDGVECREERLVRQERTWTIPAEQSALVLVDCWAEHFIRSHQEASDRIIRERLAPVVAAAWAAGVTIVHAPSPVWVEAYPQWVAYASEADLGFSEPAADPWPPEAFRKRIGEHAQFARFVEPKVTEWLREPSRYRIHEALGPEPGDFVIKTGDQLHRLLKHRKLLHLFYAGFATNICILFRDYGTRAMAQRGYNIILLRDCTTGIEHAETVKDQGLTRAAIDTVEVSAGHTTTAEQFLAAAHAAASPR